MSPSISFDFIHSYSGIKKYINKVSNRRVCVCVCVCVGELSSSYYLRT